MGYGFTACTYADREVSDNTILGFPRLCWTCVCAAPLSSRWSWKGKVHYVSAAICCVGLVLWQVFNACWVVPIVMFLGCSYSYVKDKKYMWWLEIATLCRLM